MQEAYRARRREADLPDWLGPLQQQALERFSVLGFPTPRDEDWKYTNIGRLAKTGGELLSTAPHEPDGACIDGLLSRLPRGADEPVIVVTNGRLDPQRSTLPGEASGFDVATVSTATDAVRERLADRGDDEPAFVALNSAFLADVIHVEMAPGRSAPETLHVVFVNDGQSAATQPRLLIDAAANSSARIYEHHVSAGPGWTNAVTQVRCADSAELTYVKLQDEDVAADHIASQTVELARNSRFRAMHVDLGAGLARNDLTVRFVGPGAMAEMFGLFLTDGQRHVDNHTRIDHFVGQTVSREYYRGILNDRSRGVFNGKIIVHDGADGTDAQLNNRNLLLAKTAEIDTKPELEIYTDDVKCAHGATTGQLDGDALHYLRTRGIPRAQAEHLLVLAFAREIFEQFDPDDATLLNHIDRTLERRLPG